MAPTLQSPKFTKTVVAAMQQLFPEELAERSWDNVGLLQENIEPPETDQVAAGTPTVLITNDLTIRVAEEAIKKKASVIVSYHPFIFRGFKSVTLADPHQRIMLQLAQHNIAVYSPHTAIDAAPGGMNDWLADMLDGHGVSTRRSVVKPITTPLPLGFGGAGFGRLVEFNTPVNIGRIVEAYSSGLGGLRYVMVAYPGPRRRQEQASAPLMIKSVAICAGSGFDVLKDCDADLFVTGEMTHHSALRLTMLGKCVLTVFHSNSERRFLRKSLMPRLKDVLKEKVEGKVEVLVSEEDEDPFEIWDVKDMPEFTRSGDTK